MTEWEELYANAVTLSSAAPMLRDALKQLLAECELAGHHTDKDFGWPKAIADARAALARAAIQPKSHGATP